MQQGVLSDVEPRTSELGHRLYEHMRTYTPPVSERVQDWLMLLLMEDTTLRNRLLRFVDVLAALPESGSSPRVASLFREYFQADFHRVPAPVRLALAIATSPAVPGPLLSWAAKQLTRLIARRFIVEPGAASVDRALAHLTRFRRYASFDLLGEAVLSEEEAQAYRLGYLRLLEQLARHPLAGRRTRGGNPALDVSLKLTSLSSQFNPAAPDETMQRVRPALEEICRAARAYGIGVTVDAEQYSCRDLTWHVLRETVGHPGSGLSDWPDIGMVVQAYLRDTDEHAREIVDFARRRDAPMRIRLVKGAYWDQEVIVAEQLGWPVPVRQDKADTDQSFERVTGLLLGEPGAVRLAVGSHNPRSHAYAEAVREARGLPEGAVEHQTLYRTLEALSRGLPRMDWIARDYVPVGELIPGMAYLVRRVLENTSQAGFLTRSRLHENPSRLLQPPQPQEEDRRHRRPAHPTGFVNTPVTRLFDAGERRRFQEALTATRAQWGQTYPLRLGGDHTTSAHLEPSLSPSHPDPDDPVGRVARAGEQEADRAIALANHSAAGWASRPVEERVRLGLEAAELMRARKYELAAWVVHEGARSWREALADVEEAIDHVAWNALELRRLAPGMRGRYRPVGVVACIPPWNFPSALPCGMSSGALLAGNAVVLKSAEPTPVVAQKLVDIFRQAGVPDDVLIHLPGSGETVGARLVTSPDVDMVAFTGSKKVGIQIYHEATRVMLTKGGLKRVLAEMGGKNAVVVFPDADMDEAVQGIVNSAFGHAGQKCSACSRVFIHREVYQRLKTRLVEAARSLPVGPADDPFTVVNPLIHEEARRRVLGYADVARREGRVLLDSLERPGGDGYHVGPMLVELDAGQAHSSRIMQEEVFGPIVPLVPFSTEEEAVSLVNDVAYGLTLGIFSRSPSVVSRMVRLCEAGSIYVNRDIVGSRVGIEPFGGFKLSGTGPKAGGRGYPLAFMTRSQGYRAGGTRSERSNEPGLQSVSPQEDLDLRPWDSAPARERQGRLAAALRLLEERRPWLERACAAQHRTGYETASQEALRMLDTAQSVLDRASEVTEPQPTVEVPGQANYLRWDTPRGVGIVAVDDGSDAPTLAGLVVGSLLGGNGVLVWTTPGLRDVARTLVEALNDAGVPEKTLALHRAGGSPEELVGYPNVHFAATDLTFEATHALYGALGETREDWGQRWLKALISVAEGPRPGEPDFLRRFAHPKTVAIRTLRHGADLELVRFA